MNASNKGSSRTRNPVRTRHSLLTSTSTKWQALSQDAQGLFYSKFNGDIRNKDTKWSRGLFYIGCNEVLRNIDKNIVGVIFTQKLFSLGIGNHILIACKIRNVPCIILANNGEMVKWHPGSSLSMSCVGLRGKIEPERLNTLGLKGTEYTYEVTRSCLAKLINSSQSKFDIPYLDINSKDSPQVQIQLPSIHTLVVDPKIEYPKCMRRSEKRRLRKERRSARKIVEASAN
ncbi:uncharacterized protein cubi_02875 [Cryptosporidium ubiquitum]|uniref:Uncharacterized protein n=1 Tax=Cryptosporidium ubiquitum TaxID=857276 RepID=A0A1J4MIL3_9CRYT|nr:uncharacterized protein cubi_02875 [Cryptosporidium ubiquitum]OII74073.1 hypothetical protein cubi_02875 [Cryptosporidium ubiquitum]